MPLNAYALVALFAVVALLAGVLAVRLIGPRRPWAVILPTAAAFAALYLVGHRLALSVGPTVGLFGFDVALLGDVAFALIAALATGWIQRTAIGTRTRSPA